jgi:hypothetical protein
MYRRSPLMTASHVSEASDTPESERGRALFAELLWVHQMIRRDLEAVRVLASGVRANLTAQELQSGLHRLQTNGPLWRLRDDCLRYCSFVHSHHHAEDVLLFPVLRRANRSLGAVVDRLEADHRKVSELLDAVEASAVSLTNDDSSANRRRVSDALDELADQLLEHLDYEELNAGPTLRRL